MRQSVWQTGMGLFLLFVVALLSWHSGSLAAQGTGEGRKEPREHPVVVLDAGHGGKDPGKVGVDGQLEKDINLDIVKRLKYYLEASDVETVLTRDSDKGLYSAGDSKKKMTDMKKRCEIIEETQPDLVVSIHQNSYPDSDVSGGQVFYYKASEEGRRLAEILQSRFDYVLGEENHRQAKADGNYYLLLHVKEPIVIVECGFLSNAKEARRLEEDKYQDRLAWSLHIGIMEYLNGESSGV